MHAKIEENSQSRFSLHYLLSDGDGESQAVAEKVMGILSERFPDSVFLRTCVSAELLPEGPLLLPTVELNPTISPHVLIIGIGAGGLAAYRMQTHPDNRGVSVLAICPSPGVSMEPEGGPRVLIYGSQSRVYKTAFTKDPQPYDTQVYAIPAFVHGPKLAVFAIAYLASMYMKQNDLSDVVTKLTQ